MQKLFIYIFLIVTLSTVSAVSDTLMFKGQVSAYANYNPSNTMGLGTGGRLIPQANYLLNFDNNAMLDFEGSLNIYGNANFQLVDSASVDGSIKPYRIWGRYSTEQLELRVGLQKIDFGQASMLRPLRWFDSVDPRDPLGITDGVYGALVRYYFLNNANVWLWGLYGNESIKGLEFFETHTGTIELGGRVQSPFLTGEIGLSYHHRSVDLLFSDEAATAQEQRLGIDARWDFIVGAYIEGALVNQNTNIGQFTNQAFLTLGVDYTFGLGAGLYTVVEHMVIATGEKVFQSDNSINMTALQMNYPIGMFDNIGTIIYYDWMNSEVYTFVNWFRQYDKMTFYLMAYWNPEDTPLTIPGMSTTESLMSGRGIQAMVVLNF